MGAISRITNGVYLTDKSIIAGDKGNVRHIINNKESQFYGFSEAYFSEIKIGETKGWKKHLRMTSNIIVCVGSVEFIIYDEIKKDQKNNYHKIELSSENNYRLTIHPEIWFAFRNNAEVESLILNISNKRHQLDECLNKSFEELPLPI